ncbi:MAG: histidine--tRNA ligase [Deltaproteobacteria bacterium]|jgi:histidyl-tRNA synthetase|nr:histidine--tRNA ligase [Deltaproteobacteria bacterium]
MSKISTVKGFADHLPREAAQFNRIAETARQVFAAYGYREVHIPILEYTELFARSIGTETDVVQKEMFTFPDRKERSLTLRPEATAGLMRSYIEHSIHAKEPVTKFFTHGPMFRYERPQKGRMRQFHQVDVECLGAPEPQVDAEMLLMLMEYFSALGLKDLALEINTLGCKECRPHYREALLAFLQAKPVDEFCEDCRKRMDANPLRVLDCKVPRCKELVEGAPRIADSICPECKTHFATVLGILERAGLEPGRDYKISHRLVRGLDYYTRTTFEVVSNSIGAQGSVAGGGRYDGLIASLGGPEVSGIGFACGMERLALMLPENDLDKPDFYIAVLDAAALDEALLLAQALRKNGLSGETSYNAGSAKSQLRKAANSGASYCLLLGGNELADGTVIVKNMDSGEQITRRRDDINNLIIK